MPDLRLVAVVAHDAKKDELLAFLDLHSSAFRPHELIATESTGLLLQACSDLRVKLVQSGPWGGDAQLGSLITDGLVHSLFFFFDPLSAQPHDVDVKSLLRLATLHNIPYACNTASAEYLVLSPLWENPIVNV